MTFCIFFAFISHKICFFSYEIWRCIFSLFLNSYAESLRIILKLKFFLQIRMENQMIQSSIQEVNSDIGEKKIHKIFWIVKIKFLISELSSEMYVYLYVYLKCFTTFNCHGHYFIITKVRQDEKDSFWAKNPQVLGPTCKKMPKWRKSGWYQSKDSQMNVRAQRPTI